MPNIELGQEMPTILADFDSLNKGADTAHLTCWWQEGSAGRLWVQVVVNWGTDSSTGAKQVHVQAPGEIAIRQPCPGRVRGGRRLGLDQAVG